MKRTELKRILTAGLMASMVLSGAHMAFADSTESGISNASGDNPLVESAGKYFEDAQKSAKNSSGQTSPDETVGEVLQEGIACLPEDQDTTRGAGYEDTASDDMIGQYVSQGYLNREFGFEILLPSYYTLISRALINPAGQSVIDASNDSDTYDWTRSQMSIGGCPAVFKASSDNAYIDVIMQGLGPIYDTWEDERTIAVNTAQTLEGNLTDSLGSGYTVTDFETSTDHGLFVGEDHYIILWDCSINGMFYCGYDIIMRSDDNEHVLMIEVSGTDGSEVASSIYYFIEI